MSHFVDRFYRALMGIAVGSLAMFAFAPARAHAAAALAKGLTSAAVTSTDPALRQIQINFDPACSDPSTPASLNVQAFDLSVTYDMAKLDVTKIAFDAPFIPTSFGKKDDHESSDGSEHENGKKKGGGLSLQDVSGFALPQLTKPGDVDLFSVIFTLKPGVSINDVLTFTFGAGPKGFIVGVDPNNHFKATVFTADQVVSTTIQASVAQGQITPLPPVMAMSGAGLTGLFGLTWLNRRRQTAAA